MSRSKDVRRWRQRACLATAGGGSSSKRRADGGTGFVPVRSGARIVSQKRSPSHRGVAGRSAWRLRRARRMRRARRGGECLPVEKARHARMRRDLAGKAPFFLTVRRGLRTFAGLPWGHSSAGRALAWHARGRRFDPGWLHHPPFTGIQSIAAVQPLGRTIGRSRSSSTQSPFSMSASRPSSRSSAVSAWCLSCRVG